MEDIDKFKKNYESLAAIPSLNHAEFLPYTMSDKNFAVKALWKHRNLVTTEFQDVVQTYIVNKDGVLSLPPAPCLKNTIMQKCSPTGKKEALILKKEGSYELIVEAYDQKRAVYNLSKKELHGSIYCDPYISSLNWSSDEKFIVYVAEEWQPNGTDFFNHIKSPGEGKKYLHRDDWGEQMEGQHQGVIVRVDVTTGEQSVFKLPEGLTPGEVQFVPNSLDIIGIANPAGPFRLGRAYSSDRESMIFLITPDGSYKELTPRGQHVEKMRFSPDGSKLLFIHSATFGPVAPTAQICLMDWQTKQDTFLLKYVPARYTLSGGGKFCGICPKTVFPRRCWDSSGLRFYFTALDRNTLNIYELDIATKNVRQLKHPQSLILMDVLGDKFLAKESSVLEPDSLVWGSFPPLSSFFDVDVRHITQRRSIPELSEAHWEILEFISPEHHSDKTLTLSALYIGPLSASKGSKQPLILWPHGGPHSIRPNAFDYTFATLVMSGFAILLPNYRGSTGMGADVMTGSIGSCGIDDVTDCKQALDSCLEKYGSVLDSSRIYGTGLSHGGFLVAHLSAKFPDLFKATCLMNPATDIVSIANSSDIPEWAYLEFGSTYEIGRTMDVEAINILHNRSPIKYIDTVKAPTLILLGNEDRRCPNSQGLHYHKLLLARGIPSKVFIYNDNHPLLRLSSESDGVMQILIWFSNYT